MNESTRPSSTKAPAASRTVQNSSHFPRSINKYERRAKKLSPAVTGSGKAASGSFVALCRGDAARKGLAQVPCVVASQLACRGDRSTAFVSPAFPGS